MGFEYAVTRLRGLRSRFLSDEEADSAAGGRDAGSLILLLEGSVYAARAERLKARGKGISMAAVTRCIEEGRLDVIRLAADILEEHNLADTPFIFARMELEQLKDAFRCIRIAEPVYDKRLHFFDLPGFPAWTGEWAECRNAAELKTLLLEKGHPFAAALDETLDGPQAELNMDRFFFGAWLKANHGGAAQCGGYFRDWNDLVNLHNGVLLRGHVPAGGDARPYFVQGPGRLRFSEFSRMTVMSDMEFRTRAAALAGAPLKYREGYAGFSQGLRQAYLRKWKLEAITRPSGLYEILVFFEELDAMTMNLKLAIALAEMARTQAGEAMGYMVRRRLA